jgi:hypothetical protein
VTVVDLMSCRPILRAAIFAGGAAVASCSGGGGAADALGTCPLGDPNAAAMLEIVHLDASSNVVRTQPGAQVPLLPPPQGGWIFLLGARATNLDGCRATITTSFRDVCGTAVIGLDRRPTHLDATGDGWGQTSLISYGNLPVCPQAIVTRDLHDQPYVVTVEIDDVTGKHASASLTVTPVCPDPDPSGLCQCQCDHNYVLGSSCPVGGADAGVTSCPDAN